MRFYRPYRLRLSSEEEETGAPTAIGTPRLIPNRVLSNKKDNRLLTYPSRDSGNRFSLNGQLACQNAGRYPTFFLK